MTSYDPILTAKKDLRRRILALRDGLSVQDRERLAVIMQETLFSTPEFQTASRIALFASFGSEVPTGRMISEAILAGKEVFLPAVDMTERRLRFFRVRDPETDLRPGAYGIPEPFAAGDPASPASFDLIITPGVAFDLEGHRVGYGGGYYDRVFMEAGSRPFRVGTAFELQVVERVPRGTEDLPVRLLVTEKRILRFPD